MRPASADTGEQLSADHGDVSPGYDVSMRIVLSAVVTLLATLGLVGLFVVSPGFALVVIVALLVVAALLLRRRSATEARDEVAGGLRRAGDQQQRHFGSTAGQI